MDNQLTIVIGKDLSAYTEISVPADTDLSEENLIKIANEAAENELEVDWSTASSLRVVSVHGAGRQIIKSDIPAEPVFFEGGQALQLFLKGHIDLDQLVKAAIDAKLIEPTAKERFAGRLSFPDGEFSAEFSAREGATQTELDLALLQGLAQQCTIGYSRDTTTERRQRRNNP